MSVVVDASLVVALVVADERQATVAAQFRDWIEAGESLHAPAVLPYELANVLARRVYDQALNIDAVADIWFDVANLDIEFHTMNPQIDGALIAEVTRRLRRRHATDACYIHLARQLSTRVWTLNGKLARSATDVDLPVELLASRPA